MKRIFILLIFMLCADLFEISNAADVAQMSTMSLSSVLNMAKEKNADIRAARQSWKVSQAQISPAKTWPNPTFTYVDEEFPSGSEGMPAEKIKHYRFEQMVPFPGKLSNDSRMKYHEALIAEANYNSKLFEVLGDVRMRYYQLFLIDQKITLANQSVAALRSVLQTAQSRLASSQSSTSDVFMAQMELRKMENMLFEEQQERILIQIELNTLLNRPTTTEWGSTTSPDLIDLPVSLEGFQNLARNNAPQYWAAMHETNHAKAMLSRNRLEFAPDFDLMYEREAVPSGAAGRQIGVGISFPLWFQRPVGLYKSSKEHVLETEAISEGMENMVMKMVHMEFTETTTHLNLSRNYEKDILPIAQSNLKIAREQYASGRGDFLRILEAFRTWLEANNDYQYQLYHYGEHWSLLEKWVGVDLSKAKDILAEQSAYPKENHHAH
jgi:outer membrane protein TolC